MHSTKNSMRALETFYSHCVNHTSLYVDVLNVSAFVNFFEIDKFMYILLSVESIYATFYHHTLTLNRVCPYLHFNSTHKHARYTVPSVTVPSKEKIKLSELKVMEDTAGHPIPPTFTNPTK